MRILMLGNSLTTSNGLPEMLADEVGGDVVVHARGGARLAEHLNPATKMGVRTLAALEEQRWDFVVLQEMSHGPATSAGAYLRSVGSLSELIRDNGAQPVIYGTWAYRDDCPKLKKLKMNAADMNALMGDAFARAASENCCLLADVREEFWSHPSKQDLFASDGVHPSPEGSSLAARCIAKAIASAS